MQFKLVLVHDSTLHLSENMQIFHYETTVSIMMANTSFLINKTNKYISPQFTEHKR